MVRFIILSCMKLRSKRHLNLFILILVLFGFCFHSNQMERYRPAPPHIMTSLANPYQRQGIHISAKAYNSRESRLYLGRDLLKKGLQPIQLTVQNSSPNTFYLSKKGVDVSHVDVSSVTHILTRSYIPRAIGFKVASFFFWPFLIPSAIDSIFTFHNHRKMKRDYRAKALKEKGELLLPYSTTYRILFLRKGELRDSVTVYLQDSTNLSYRPYPTTIETSR